MFKIETFLANVHQEKKYSIHHSYNGVQTPEDHLPRLLALPSSILGDI